MKVKELIEKLKGVEDWEIVLGSDEELNEIYDNIEVSELTDRKNTIVLWG